MMSAESLQKRIDALPRDHEPRAYVVTIYDRRQKVIARRYVRASSKERASLTGLRVNKYVFGNNATRSAVAFPDGWSKQAIGSNVMTLAENPDTEQR